MFLVDLLEGGAEFCFAFRILNRRNNKVLEEGYEQFRIGVVLKQAREKAGLTQEELARRLKTKKTAISRIENHAEDIRLSTLEKVAHALGKRLEVKIA
jgi:HTH-type transcriptional regulator / antitoxin HipB